MKFSGVLADRATAVVTLLLAVGYVVAQTGCAPQREARWASLYGLELQVRNFSGVHVGYIEFWKEEEPATVWPMVLDGAGIGDGEEQVGYLPGPAVYVIRAEGDNCTTETTTTPLEAETRVTWNIEPGVFSNCLE